ncbi:hypothetical protein SIN8267_00131 [Sinobacterium norvegicum]|uniref:Hemerythrin-like domain-containing protein n=1 Tax=Sinobacterium norvegicum TaxID=1641715 RepID=A0ABM9AA08_9GAMM|nr:hemerythrin domain-containing protein [Sinobacterium norvegicum]CAH0990048.1 hypothetical protein SIN8267_00131 [Sinobacterium norvegicum]
MNNLFHQLVDDHKHIARVLRVLKAAVYAYEDVDQEHDLPLILETLDYIQAYPEQYHHPLEERAFTYLLQHSLGDGDVIAQLQQQHTTLERETRDLQQSFDAIANDAVVPLTTILRQFDHYLDDQLAHLETENKRIFPVLAKLTDSQWWVIASDLYVDDNLDEAVNISRDHFCQMAAEIEKQGRAIAAH